MKKLIFNLIAIVGLVVLVASCSSERKENPRGVYNLVSLIGTDKQEMPAPYEQYKICTDSITWTLFINDANNFRITDNDHWTLNYTGEEPDAEYPYKARVFDSDANGFRLKWWSIYPESTIFPYNDWCTEVYQAGQLTPTASMIIDALTKPAAASPDQPLLGQWYFVTVLMGDSSAIDLNLDWKGNKSIPEFMILTEQDAIGSRMFGNSIYPVRYISAEEFEFTDTHLTGHIMAENPDLLIIMPEEHSQDAADQLDEGPTADDFPTVWARDKSGMTLLENIQIREKLFYEVTGQAQTNEEAQ